MPAREFSIRYGTYARDEALMTENKRDVAADTSSESQLEARILLLERALVEYIERYGLTDKAREMFCAPRR